VGGLHDMVNSPKYATAVGLLLYGAENRVVKSGGGDFRIRDDNVFNRILGRMKKWFVDIA
jgi:cell division protein FtsA